MNTTRLAASAFALLASAASASAADWIVDASGATSTLTTIEQAMVQAFPGDRILVQPGSYPAFHFSRGVDVIGLGSDPGQVRIQRIDFHVNIPIQDFEAGIENVSVCGDAGGISIGGNELSAGTLVITASKICDGIFLHGAGELYVMVTNSEVVADPGDGFLGATVDLGGGVFDLVDSRIVAADASEALGLPAGVALRIEPGSVVRVSGCDVLGGLGVFEGGLEDGGSGIDQSPGPGQVRLRLSGDTTVIGGDAPFGVGGSGVDVVGQIEIGAAQVFGGQGQDEGPEFASTRPTLLGFDPHLRLVPAKSFAEGDPFLHPNHGVMLVTDPSLPQPTLASAPSLTSPAAPDFSPLTQTTMRLMILDSMGIESPGTLGKPSGLPAKRVYAQVFFPDPNSTTGAVLASNPVAITVAH